MALTANKITILNVQRNGLNIPLYVETGDQSKPNQPLLFVHHGSGGISSCESLWLRKAFEHGWTACYLDSCTPRGIYKINFKNQLSSFERAYDVIAAIRCLIDNMKMIPFCNPSQIIMIGASHGAATGIRMLTNRFYFEHTNFIQRVYALYPGVHPYETDYDTIDGNKLEIHVGEFDNWTPAGPCKVLAERTKSTIFVHKGIHHGFSKPNSIGVWPDNVISHNIPYDDPTSSDELYNKSGRAKMIFDKAVKEKLHLSDVRVEYNEDVVNFIEKRVFG
ncbi:MAG: hypothetical protein WC284_15340 [Candidimonas sp.]